MANRCCTHPINILPNINFGLNVSIDINKMIKYLAPAIMIALVGCASPPEKTYYTPDMNNFVASCKHARTQIDYLTNEINNYNEYYKDRPTTLEDRRTYGRMKNALWSLRSSCSAKQL
jgi:hypothetical protein